MSLAVEKKVISKLGQGPYDLFLNHFLADRDETKLVEIARKVSDKLGGTVQSLINKSEDWRFILRSFFMKWEQMFADTKDDEKELTVRRLIKILQHPDVLLCSLAQDISKAGDYYLQIISV